MSVYEWSTTAASNATADAAINWAEGQAPSTVNNSARAEMAAMAAFFEAIGGAETTGGTGAAYTLTLNIVPTAYTTSMLFLVKMSTVSTSTTATINVNSLGAKTLKMWDGSALPTAAYLPQDAYVFMKYDGTDMRVFLPANAPDLASNNVFTGTTQTIRSADAGAGNSPFLVLNRNSASPAAADELGVIDFTGNDSGGNNTFYAIIKSTIVDPTDTSEDGDLRFLTMSAGSSAVRMTLGAGLYTSGATGDDQGAGTINADAVYDDGVLLCAPIEEANTGSYDAGKWAEMAPHDGIAAYEAMKARGYAPKSADSFAAEIASHEGIPGYWNEAEWKARTARTRKDDKGNEVVDRVSLAERHERLMLAMDLQALAIADLTARLKTLEGK